MVKKVRFFEPSELLSKEEHINLRWRCLGGQCSLNCCQRARTTVIALSEVPSASRFFPIVFPFVKQEDGSLKLKMEALYALSEDYAGVDDEGGCIYLDPNTGCTLGEDRLFACKQYPFAGVRDSKNRDLYGLKIALDCPGWSNTEGEKVFDDSKELTPYFRENFAKFAFALASSVDATNHFLNTLMTLRLLVPRDIFYKGIRIKVNTIDIQKLNTLDSFTIKKLIGMDYLRLMYHAFDSLANFSKLVDVYIRRKNV